VSSLALGRNRSGRIHSLGLASAFILLLIAYGSPVASAQHRSPATGPSSTAEVSVHDGSDSDTAAIAKMLGLSLEATRAYLDEVPKAAALETDLQARYPDTFAGLRIVRSSEFKIEVFCACQGSKGLWNTVEQDGLSGQVTLTSVANSLAELRASAQAILDVRGDSEFDLMVDEPTNTIQITASSPEDARIATADVSAASLQVPRGDVHVTVGPVARPTLNIYGGLHLNITTGDCTAGFSVDGPSGGEGTTTAAHCGNTASFSGVSLNFQDGDLSGGQDIQWYKTPNISDKAWALDGDSTARTIRGRLKRAEMPNGMPFCEYGITSHYGCGFIYSKDFAPSYVHNATATFILGHSPDGDDLSSPGDSGGPVYYQDQAVGIISGTVFATDVIFMAQNYMSALDISVKLAS
jgi:hypothetical protein